MWIQVPKPTRAFNTVAISYYGAQMNSSTQVQELKLAPEVDDLYDFDSLPLEYQRGAIVDMLNMVPKVIFAPYRGKPELKHFEGVRDEAVSIKEDTWECCSRPTEYSEYERRHTHSRLDPDAMVKCFLSCRFYLANSSTLGVLLRARRT